MEGSVSRHQDVRIAPAGVGAQVLRRPEGPRYKPVAPGLPVAYCGCIWSEPCRAAIVRRLFGGQKRVLC